MSPDTLAREIKMGMVLIGSQDHFFKFKTLTPIFPTMREKLTNPSFYDKTNWTFAKSRQEYLQETKELNEIYAVFERNQDCSKEELMGKFKKLPANFDTIYDFLSQLVYINKNYDPDLELSGRLWLRELYIQAQNTIP